MTRESEPSTGVASMMSRPLPWGMPSTMSISTTSASSRSAIRCASVAPTLPPPTTVTLRFILLTPHPIPPHVGGGECCDSVRRRSLLPGGWLLSPSSPPELAPQRVLAVGQFAAGACSPPVGGRTLPQRSILQLEVLDDRAREFRGLQDLGAFHLALEVVGHALLCDRAPD